MSTSPFPLYFCLILQRILTSYLIPAVRLKALSSHSSSYALADYFPYSGIMGASLFPLYFCLILQRILTSYLIPAVRLKALSSHSSSSALADYFPYSGIMGASLFPLYFCLILQRIWAFYLIPAVRPVGLCPSPQSECQRPHAILSATLLTNSKSMGLSLDSKVTMSLSPSIIPLR